MQMQNSKDRNVVNAANSLTNENISEKYLEKKDFCFRFCIDYAIVFFTNNRMSKICIQKWFMKQTNIFLIRKNSHFSYEIVENISKKQLFDKISSSKKQKKKMFSNENSSHQKLKHSSNYHNKNSVKSKCFAPKTEKGCFQISQKDINSLLVAKNSFLKELNRLKFSKKNDFHKDITVESTSGNTRKMIEIQKTSSDQLKTIKNRLMSPLDIINSLKKKKNEFANNHVQNQDYVTSENPVITKHDTNSQSIFVMKKPKQIKNKSIFLEFNKDDDECNPNQKKKEIDSSPMIKEISHIKNNSLSKLLIPTQDIFETNIIVRKNQNFKKTPFTKNRTEKKSYIEDQLKKHYPLPENYINIEVPMKNIQYQFKKNKPHLFNSTTSTNKECLLDMQVKNKNAPKKHLQVCHPKINKESDLSFKMNENCGIKTHEQKETEAQVSLIADFSNILVVEKDNPLVENCYQSDQIDCKNLHSTASTEFIMRTEIEKYEAAVNEGCNMVCLLCCGLFFTSQVTKLKPSNIQKLKGLGFTSSVDSTYACKPCKIFLNKNKLHPLALRPHEQFVKVPPEISILNEIEAQLVSPRIPFVTVRNKTNSDKQYILLGDICNIKININNSLDFLKIISPKSDTYYVKLKRKLAFEKAFIEGPVNPFAVCKALNFLVSTELYELDNTNFDFNGISKVLQSYKPQICKGSIFKNFNISKTDQNHTIHSPIEIAPGEGLDPISYCSDKYAEELSFPVIYCGKKFAKEELTYFQRCKSEFRRYDRRCQLNIFKIFYSTKKLITKKIHNSISVIVSNQCYSKRLTANFYREEHNVDKLIQKNEATVFLRGIRASPQYWLEKKRILQTMISQLGPPTFFMTLSPNENECTELLQCLINLNPEYKNVNIETINKQKCFEIIAKDPILTARYFSRKIQKLFKHVILSKNGSFAENEILDFFLRVEFQKRGSPHVHFFLWGKNLNPCMISDEEKIKIADKYITNDASVLSIYDIHTKNSISLKCQIHRHMKNCDIINKYKNKECKYNFPGPILSKSVFLYPFEGSYTRGKQLNDLLTNIKNFITNQYNNSNYAVTDKDILFYFNISHDVYLLSISTSLSHPKVIQKRNMRSAFCNNYNESIFTRHRSNMDIQLVSDPQKALYYITSYLVKDQQDVLSSLSSTCKTLETVDISYRRKLFKLARTYLNKTRMSAQEAAFFLLGLSFTRCSRKIVIINTLPREIRGYFLKRDYELWELEPNSTEVFVADLFWFYENRPSVVYDICLAEFATGYEKSKKNFIDFSEQRSEKFTILKDNSCYEFVKRKDNKLLRYDSYYEGSDHYNFLRVLCLIFLPFRCEKSEIENFDILQVYEKNKTKIIKNYQKFHKISPSLLENELVTIEKKIQNLKDRKKSSQSNEIKLTEEEKIIKFGYEADNYDEEMRAQPIRLKNQITSDIFPDAKNIAPCKEKQPELNQKQKEYIQIFRKSLFQSRPFYHLVLGGAGTGKSFLIDSVEKNFHEIKKIPSHKIIRTAFTGKASFGIKGVTLHSLFHIPTQMKFLEPLKESTLQNDQIKWGMIKCLIIDEISMVGSSILDIINKRLQQIFDNQELFGGMSIIAFGDLRQLSPVMDSLCFASKKDKVLECWRLFKLFELTEIMRQKDDLNFAQALSVIGDFGLNACSNRQIDLFNSRITQIKDIPRNAIYICSTNEEVQIRNLEAIQKLPGDAFTCLSYDTAKGINSNTHIAQNRLKACEKWPLAKTCNLPHVLILKKGIKYTITINLSVMDGLANGSVGSLYKIIFDREDPNEILRVWLIFEDANIGKQHRQSNLIREMGKSDCVELDLNIVCIERMNQRIHRDRNGLDISIERYQFPLVECEAITIHKAQGQTYNCVAVNIDENHKKSMLYVALSRVTKLSGLFLYGSHHVLKKKYLNLSEIERVEQAKRKSTKDKLFQEMKRLRQSKNLLRYQ